MDNELGARIRTLRKERGLSQEALAQALEVSRQAVTKWEDASSSATARSTRPWPASWPGRFTPSPSTP